MILTASSALRWLQHSVLALLAGFVLCGNVLAQSDALRLVLVASTSSPVENMSALEVRRLYLGVPVTVAGQNIEALRYTEHQAQEVFLQKVLFMSLNAYERQIVTHTFRTGRPKPEELGHVAGVTEALLGNPQAVSYLPEEEVRKARGLKIVGKLWNVAP
jgi:hypothetical protein